MHLDNHNTFHNEHTHIPFNQLTQHTAYFRHNPILHTTNYNIHDFYYSQPDYLDAYTQSHLYNHNNDKNKWNEKLLQVYIGGISVVGLLLLYRMLDK